MNSSAELADIFPGVSKEAWLDKIRQDLKGREPDSLYWEVEPGIVADPFAHADDFLDLPPSPPQGLLQWAIGEKILIGEDLVVANRQIMEALEGGAEALLLKATRLLDAEALDLLLKGVHLNYIRLYIGGEGVAHGPAAWGAALATLARMRDLSPDSLQGGIAWDPTADTLPDWAYVADYLAYMQETLPRFDAFGLRESADGLYSARSAALLARAHTLLVELSRRGASVEAALARLGLTQLVGVSYFAEIARLRALRLLWPQWRDKCWGLRQEPPLVSAEFAQQAYGDEPFQNLIKTATIAMSAILGGAGCVYARPYDDGRPGDYPPELGRRMARNAQHLLRMESGFEALEDPVSGAYFLEKLTRQFAEKIWSNFQQLT